MYACMYSYVVIKQLQSGLAQSERVWMDRKYSARSANNERIGMSTPESLLGPR